jgi:hypothetical protein
MDARIGRAVQAKGDDRSGHSANAQIAAWVNYAAAHTVCCSRIITDRHETADSGRPRVHTTGESRVSLSLTQISSACLLCRENAFEVIDVFTVPQMEYCMERGRFIELV